MITTEKETSTKKAAAPSVAQINAEYVTQVKVCLYCVFIVLWNLIMQCSCTKYRFVDLNIFYFTQLISVTLFLFFKFILLSLLLTTLLWPVVPYI